MDNKKICPNQTCRTENPSNAQYCRSCGTPIQDHAPDDFTLDTFKGIQFMPVSVVKVSFINNFLIVLWVLFLTLAILASTTTGKYILREMADEMDIYWNSFPRFVRLLSILLTVVLSVSLLKSAYRKLMYKYAAEYIEQRFIENDLVRIAKKSKMGLFDKKRRKVLLQPKYTNIEKFDADHLIISVDKTQGIYSLPLRKIIVPVQCEHILPFSNCVTTVKIHGQECHYDVKGNKLR